MIIAHESVLSWLPIASTTRWLSKSVAVPNISDTDFHRLIAAPGVSHLRLLDEYVLVFDETVESAASACEQALFEMLAPTYQSNIDLANNLDNIEFLISLIRGPKVLDYGCGPGVILTTPQALPYHIVGCDRSPRMVAMARAAGLTAFPSSEIEQVPSGSFDSAISSYAMHLHSAREDLRDIGDKIRTGGLFAANFHKGIGLEEVSTTLAGVGFVCQTVRGQAPRNHGLYGLWRRR